MNMPWMNQQKDYEQYKIGRGTYGNPKVDNWGKMATLEIGAFCSFARGVTIMVSGEHRPGLVTTFPLVEYLLPTPFFRKGGSGQNYSRGDVKIGSDVWVGIDAVIRSGVTIGHGAVIGMRAVVTHDVPPYAVVAGVPARILKYRFPAEQRERLLRVAWWDWPDERIREFMPLLMSDRVDEFLEKAEAVSL